MQHLGTDLWHLCPHGSCILHGDWHPPSPTKVSKSCQVFIEVTFSLCRWHTTWKYECNQPSLISNSSVPLEVNFKEVHAVVTLISFPIFFMLLRLSRTLDHMSLVLHASRDSTFPRMYMPCFARESNTLTRFFAPKKPILPSLLFLVNERIMTLASSPWTLISVRYICSQVGGNYKTKQRILVPNLRNF